MPSEPNRFNMPPMYKPVDSGGWVPWDELMGRDHKRDHVRETKPADGTALVVVCPKGHRLIIVQRPASSGVWRGVYGRVLTFRLDDPAQRPFRALCKCGEGHTSWAIDLDRLRAQAREAVRRGHGSDGKGPRRVQVERVAPD